MKDWLKNKTHKKVIAITDEHGTKYNPANKTDYIKLSSIEAPTIVQYEYDNGEMAMGVAVNTSKPYMTDYLKDLKDYNNPNADIKDQIRLSRKLYIWEGIVGTVIDILCDFATTNVVIGGLDGKAKEIVNFWQKNLNRSTNNITNGLKPLSRQASWCNFVDGNIIIYRKWSKVQYATNKTAQMPMMVVPIDPLIIDIPEETVAFGNKEIYLDISDYNTYNPMKRRKKAGKETPLKFRQSVKNKENRVLLTDDEVYHIKRRGTTFGAWGVPYLTRSFSPIYSKRRLRSLDDNTSERLINSITIFKVGDADHPKTWDPARISKLRDLVSDPSKSLNLIWAYDLEVEHISPDAQVLGFADKYKQVNYDIIAALGISNAILAGQGDRAGDVWVNVQVMLERLEEYRDEFKEMIRQLVIEMLEKNKIFGEEPTVRMPMKPLRIDDIRDRVLASYDRGLMDEETAIEALGGDYDEEVAKKKRTKADPELVDLFAPPTLPFSNNSGNEEKDNEKDNKEKDPRRPEQIRDDKKRTQPKTKIEVNMKKKRGPRTEAFLNTVNKSVKSLNDEFSQRSEKYSLVQAALWYGDRAIEIAELFENSSNIVLQYGEVTKACKTNNTFAIVESVKSLAVSIVMAAREVVDSGDYYDK